MDSFSSLIEDAELGSFSTLIDDADLIYLYDGSLEGMLTAIFAAYGRHENPLNIVEANDLQESMLCAYVPIKTEERYAVRVQKGIIEKLGDRTYDDIKKVFLSDDSNKGGVLLRFLRYAFKAGRWASSHLAETPVADFLEIRKAVENEAHYMTQFVRFAQLENGIFFAQIEPKASIVPLITDHFARRLNIQPFIIYDSAHKLASVFDTQRWWLVSAAEIQQPEPSQLEQNFQALWQTFFDTIAIEERRNPRCQRNFMPKRFWGNMCEHIPPELRKIQPGVEAPSKTIRLQAAAQRLLETEVR